MGRSGTDRDLGTRSGAGVTMRVRLQGLPSGAREWWGSTQRHVAFQPILGPSALVAALVALVVALSGATPPVESGRVIAVLVPLIAAVAAPIIAGLLVLDPWAGLLVWLAAMPALLLARVQVVVGPVQITLTTVMVAALLLGAVLERRRPDTVGYLLPRRWLVVVWLIGGLAVLLGLASAAASPDAIFSLQIALHGLVEPVVLAVLVVSLARGVRPVGWLALAMGTSVALAGVYTALLVLRLGVRLTAVEAARVHLAHLTYFNIGLYGEMLAMALPLTFAVLLVRHVLGLRPWATGLILLGFALSVFGLYVTFSKSAWIGAIVAVGILIIVTVGTWRRRVAIALAGLVVAALFIPYPLYVLDALHVDRGLASSYTSLASRIMGPRFASWNPESSEGEVSITERLLATQAALAMAVDHPLLGVGPGEFQKQYESARYHPAAATRPLQSAHDLIANLAAEFGLPMAALVVAALGLAALGSLRALRSRDRLVRMVGAGFGAALVGFVIVAQTFGVDLYRDYRVMNADVLFAGLIIAALVVLGYAAGRESPPT